MVANPNLRDSEERAAVAAALAALPPEHPARRAISDGIGTIALAHLVVDRPELVEGLKEAWLAGYNRMLRRSGGHFRP
jgi:hypothetical protein